MANSAITRAITLAEASVTEAQLAAGATLKLGTEQVSTSGTSIDFTGIPAGTKMIVIMMEDVSTNGASAWLIQLGDSGGIEATGYTASCSQDGNAASNAVATSTVGFPITNGNAANSQSGRWVLNLKDATDNTWVLHGGGVYPNATTFVTYTAGIKSLSAALDRVRITSATPDTFDAGSINIAYK